MGRKKPDDMDKIRKAIAEILAYHKDRVKYIDGKPSSESIRKLIKEFYDFETTRQFVYKTIKEGEYGRFVNTLNIEDDPRIIELKEALLVQQKLWKSDDVSSKDRTMAANSWRALQKQLIEYEKNIADIRIKETEASRPIYLVRFYPPSVDVICPKCGYTWFDIRDEDEKKDATKEKKRAEKEKEERGEGWKPFYKKDDEKQKQVDDFIIEDKDDETKTILKKKTKKVINEVDVDDAS